VFERFTELAKRAVAASEDAALSLGHDFIGTEHLLLGLLAEGEGVAIQVLTALGAETAALREAVLSRVAQQAS
jgi:ATP-dependent Clp protease ATP-binding subunit ClpC